MPQACVSAILYIRESSESDIAELSLCLFFLEWHHFFLSITSNTGMFGFTVWFIGADVNTLVKQNQPHWDPNQDPALSRYQHSSEGFTDLVQGYEFTSLIRSRGHDLIWKTTKVELTTPNNAKNC